MFETRLRCSVCTVLLAAGLVVGCGSGSGNQGTSGDGGVGDGASGSSGGSGGGSGGSSSGSGSSSSSGSSSGGSASSSGGTPDSGTIQTSDGGVIHPGNPNGSCSTGIPAKGQPVDTSNPTTRVGTGTAASCTFSALEAAVTKGGIITFDCGSAPVTIAVTATLNVPVGVNTVIDGGGLVTLDGGNAVQILSFNSPGWQTNTYGLTIQHMAFTHAKTNPTDRIPTAPSPCSQGWDDGQGGAIYMRDGYLVVIDSLFTDNQAAPLGPDTGGGAIYVQGSKTGTLVVGSTFTGNSASNAGAVGGLFNELDVYDSLFTGNKAIGMGANNDDPTKCSAMNNGQNEIGSGGNGGALYSDGNSVNVILCGDDIEDNAAGTGAFGGGLFFTSDNMEGTLTITDTTMAGNTGGSWTNVSGGSVTNAGTAIGVNAKSITIAGSTIQGVP